MMLIKLDENLPSVLTDVLAEFGHETDTVPQEAWLVARTRIFGKR